jgi:hypothetical protein
VGRGVAYGYGPNMAMAMDIHGYGWTVDTGWLALAGASVCGDANMLILRVPAICHATPTGDETDHLSFLLPHAVSDNSHFPSSLSNFKGRRVLA